MGREMIDWTDERAIGLRCWMWDEGICKTIKTFHSTTRQDDANWYRDTDGELYECCCLAGGDKAPYAGKGQPIPDGIWIATYSKSGRLVQHVFSEEVDWKYVDIYQVQEQSETKLHIITDSTKQIPLQLIDEVIKCLRDIGVKSTNTPAYKLITKLKEL